ncbi:tRNA dimethylallyltransferase [Anopheles nili]|uniref:tRNA dimethylallyltransferase n=1 Tax=Anopheles nili TaxID=185578 RepID=UPI00237A98F4|nr:tRNA dimethylallyltransferase [Anopheles nili]
MVAVPPIVVILGATGTGKTKLSLELAARYGGEVISADSMQVYKGLDIVTAKATQDEQRQAVHHLLDVVTPDQTFTVTHFQERALPIIDSLLATNRMPIVVGGTNYYIESVLWRVLLGEGVKRERVRTRSTTDVPEAAEPEQKHQKTDVAATEPLQEDQLLDRLLEELPTMASGDELEEYESTLLHRALQRVDPGSADRLHPNNKRKIIRALEVYMESGGQNTMSQVLAKQRTGPGACCLGGPLRYENVIILWLRCDQEILNRRLETRVDNMVSQGLLPEIRTFYEEYVKPYQKCDLHRGILQSIGFKEFVKYLQQYGPEQDRVLLEYLTTNPDVRGPKPAGHDLLVDCLDYLKLVTRRYARRQLQWIRNRFLSDTGREVPSIYSIDTDNVDQWMAQVTDRTVAIIEAVMAGQTPPYSCVPRAEQGRQRLQEERTFHCEVCQRVFIGEHQWQLHIRSNKHRKVVKQATKSQPESQQPQTSASTSFS